VPGTAGGGRGAALDTSPVLKFREQQETAPPRHPDQDNLSVFIGSANQLVIRK
jgi:hypothetical protein